LRVFLGFVFLFFGNFFWCQLRILILDLLLWVFFILRFRKLRKLRNSIVFNFFYNLFWTTKNFIIFKNFLNWFILFFLDNFTYSFDFFIILDQINFIIINSNVIIIIILGVLHFFNLFNHSLSVFLGASLLTLTHFLLFFWTSCVFFFDVDNILGFLGIQDILLIKKIDSISIRVTFRKSFN